MKKNKSLVLLYIFLILFLLFGSNLNAQQRYTKYRLTSGLAINGNLHSADFGELPGFENCCVNFSGDFGIGYSVFAGAEYMAEDRLLGMNWSFGLLLEYANLSVPLSERDEKFAHIIFEDHYVDGVADHIIDPSINAISVDMGMTFYPFESLPLGIRPGFKVGFLQGMTFTQEERLVSPSGVTWENGSTVRNETGGDIPEAASALLALSLALKYDTYEFDNFLVTPQLQFNYGLNNFSSVDWKINSANLGIAINYRVPRPERIPPMPAPMPLFPEPPSSAGLDLALNVSSRNNPLHNNSQLIYNLFVEEKTSSFSILPVVFFKDNSAEFIDNNHKFKEGFEKAQHNVFDELKNYVKNNPGLNIRLIAKSLDTESPDIADLRIKKVKDILISTGIDANRIHTDKETVKISSLNHDELKEENRAVWFEFDDKKEILNAVGDTSVTITSGKLNLEIRPEIKAEAGISEFNGKILLGGNDADRFDADGKEWNYKFDDEADNPQYDAGLTLIAELKDGEGKNIKETVNLELTPIVKRIQSYENLISENDNEITREYILGYFDFDESQFSYFDDNVGSKIKSAVEAGKTVQIYPLTDRTGSKEHNARLAVARMYAALNKLGINKEDVQIIIPENFLFSNDSPYGRILNRSILVRIKDTLE